MMKTRLLLVAVLLFGMYGCTSTPDPSPTDERTSVPVAEGYPPPPQTIPSVNVSGYPGPDSSTQAALPTVDLSTALTPTPDAGVVIGKLVDDAGRPFLGTLYLGGTIDANQPGFQPIVEFSDQNPRADVDPVTGQFVFTTVPPGTYGLIWWTPVGSDLIFVPDRSAMLTVNVSAGAVTDMGSVLFVSSR